MIKPLGENVLLELIELETTTASGLIMTINNSVSTDMRTAIVRAVNDDSKLSVNDRVYIPGMNLMAARINIDGKEMYLVVEKVIVAKIID